MASVDGSRSLHMASDDAPDNLCDPCKFGGIQINCSHYCKTCAEYLCTGCKDLHEMFKATRNHVVVSSEEAGPDVHKASQFKVYCACDQALEVSVYCEIHNEAVCNTCKSVKHRKCNITTLQEKGATYKLSDIHKVIQKVTYLEDEIKKFEQARDTDVQQVESMVEKCREQIKTCRRDLDLYLDALENNMLSELEEKSKKMRCYAEQHLQICTTTLKLMDDDAKKLDDAAKSSNAQMVFAADTKISKRLKELESMINDFRDEVKPSLLEFERKQKLLNLKQEVKTLGCLRVIESQKTKTENMNFLKMNVQTSRDVQIKLPDDKKTPWITGCTFMPDGQLVLCDRYNYKIKLLSSTLDITVSLGLDSWPWDISTVDSNTAVVTIPDRKQLQFMQVVPTLKTSQTIQLDQRCYGVDCRDEIYVVSHDNPGNAEICVFGITGIFTRKVPDVQNILSSLKLPYYLAVSKTLSSIYLSDWSTAIVTCLSVDGSSVFKYQQANLQTPRGVIVDEEGNSLICGQGSCNIHQVTSTGQQHSVLYTVQGKTDNGCCRLAYRPVDGTLVIGFVDNILLVLQLVRSD